MLHFYAQQRTAGGAAVYAVQNGAVALPATTAVATALATGALTTAIPLSGSAAGVATASGALSTAIPMTGSATAQASSSASLSTQIALSGAASAQATANATLTAGSGMSASASAQAQASASAALTTAIALAGSAIAQAQATASLSGQATALAGSASVSASASAQLSTGISLVAAANAVSAGTAALSTQIALVAIAQAQASAGAQLSPPAGAYPNQSLAFKFGSGIRTYVVPAHSGAGGASGYSPAADDFMIDPFGKPSILKSPLAVMDYYFDWTTWLATVGDAIDRIEMTGSGCTVESNGNNDNVAGAWVSGGVVNVPATLTCEITTVAGRVDERTVYLQIAQR